MSRSLPALRLVTAGGLVLAAGMAFAQQTNDYPTTDRVVFVMACMRDHPGNHFEMINKCSCAIDAIARDLPFESYTSMSTALNANTIGGERGGYIRDTELLQGDIRKFRQLTTKAKKDCFINVR
jgi:hypothetical protein